VVENPGLAFDLANTLVESTRRAVLGERSIAFSEADDLPRLFKSATTYLPFLPPEASAEADIRKSLAQTVNGLHTAIQGICELRNQCGFASHGPGSARPAMESVQALLAAGAADAIIGFLHRVHRQDRALPPSAPQAAYDDNPTFNDWVDGENPVLLVFDVKFRPSEVLFKMEPETYRVYLGDFDAAAEGTDDGGTPDAPLDAGP
jgi:hypothetical protein